jgi:hypothetical protein
MMNEGRRTYASLYRDLVEVMYQVPGTGTYGTVRIRTYLDGDVRAFRLDSFLPVPYLLVVAVAKPQTPLSFTYITSP